MKRLFLILAAVLLMLGGLPLSASGSSGSDDDSSGSSQESDDARDDDDADDDGNDSDDRDDDVDDDDDADDDADDDGHHQRRHRNRNREGDDDADDGGSATPNPGGTPSGPEPATATVQLLDKSFNPSMVRVAVGGRVTWDNGSGREHTVTGDGFDSGVMSSGQFSHTFGSAGTIQYRCLIHSGMNGTVVVGDGPAATGSSAAGSSSASRSAASSSGATSSGGAGGSSGLPSLSAPVQPPIAAAAADTASVEVRDFEFAPPDVTVAAGGSVTWTLVGQAPHTVTGDGFDSGTLESGDTHTETFDKPGTVDYRCNFHPEMTGTVTVVSATGGAAAGDGDSGGAPGDTADAAGSDDTAASGGSESTESVLANSGITTVPLLVTAFALLIAGGTLVVRRVRRTA